MKHYMMLFPNGKTKAVTFSYDDAIQSDIRFIELLNKYNLNFVILMFGKDKINADDVKAPVYSFDEVVEMGKNHEFVEVEQNVHEDCTMLYTSGTTGNPKGVMISFGNIYSQLKDFESMFKLTNNHTLLSILPLNHFRHYFDTYIGLLYPY